MKQIFIYLLKRKKTTGATKIFSTCFLINCHIYFEMYEVDYLFFKFNSPDNLLFNKTIEMIY